MKGLSEQTLRALDGAASGILWVLGPSAVLFGLVVVLPTWAILSLIAAIPVAAAGYLIWRRWSRSTLATASGGGGDA